MKKNDGNDRNEKFKEYTDHFMELLKAQRENNTGLGAYINAYLKKPDEKFSEGVNKRYSQAWAMGRMFAEELSNASGNDDKVAEIKKMFNQLATDLSTKSADDIAREYYKQQVDNFSKNKSKKEADEKE